MTEGFAAAVTVVDGFTGNGIAVNRSAAALLNDQPGLAGLAVLELRHGWVGIEGHRIVMSDRTTMSTAPCSCHAFIF